MPPDRAESDRRAVVVSGIGLVTSLGADRETTWNAVREGRSGLRSLPDGEAGAPLPFAVPDEDEPVLFLLDRLADEAVADAKLDLAAIDRSRVAALLGLSKGGIRSLARLHAGFDRLDDSDRARLWRDFLPGSGASRIAGRLDLSGPTSAPIAACATGLVAVLQGAALIRRGDADFALAGSADASLEPLVLAAFRNMKALAPLTDDPAKLIRPWDADRAGFLVGEGGAVLVLESEASAIRRGARIYARVSGGGLGSDAHHIVNLNPDPTRLARLIGRTLARAGVDPSEVDHANVHGTATRPNDPLECRALRLALGRFADGVSCSANKAQIGHLLGAAGSVELALTCLAIRDGFVPPTMNLENPDPFCDLDGTPGIGRSRDVRRALKISIGFGGHLAVALLSHPEAS